MSDSTSHLLARRTHATLPQTIYAVALVYFRPSISQSNLTTFCVIVCRPGVDPITTAEAIAIAEEDIRTHADPKDFNYKDATRISAVVSSLVQKPE
jgi:hypothetical protein